MTVCNCGQVVCPNAGAAGNFATTGAVAQPVNNINDNRIYFN
jgi:hypothetical protein